MTLTANMAIVLALIVSCSAFAETADDTLTVMSLNIFGWKTMPKHSGDYAKLIKSQKVDILGIQEGVEDWKIDTKLPTDYQRANTLKKSLGTCWQHKFQIFINQCQGNNIVESGRFDLSDGPNVTRTGEYAVIEKSKNRYLFVNVHWDHESAVTRKVNAEETVDLLNQTNKYPKILLGDFNSQCVSEEVGVVRKKSDMQLLNKQGIDCILIRGLTGQANAISAHPSDHPAILATLIFQQ